jgi:hypothetical protein
VATFGKTTIGAGGTALVGDQGGDNTLQSQVSLSQQAIVSDIQAYLRQGSSTPETITVTVFIATDVGGAPGTILALASASFTFGATPQWYSIPLSITLNAGTYWIGIFSAPAASSGGVAAYYDTGGSSYYKGAYSAMSVGGAYTPGQAQARSYSFFADFSPALTPVGKSLALPWVKRVAVGKSAALPFSLIPVVGRSLSLAYTITSIVGGSVALPWQTIARIGRSLSALWSVAQAVVGRSVEFRYGVGAPAAIPGRTNADTYLDGASNPFGIASITTTDISIYGSYYFPWRPRMPEPEIELARLPYDIAQSILGETGAKPSTRQRVVLGWHGTGLDPERGSVAVVPPGGKLALLVGKRVRFTYRGGTVPRFVVAYVSAAVLGIPDDEDISVSRRTFLALSPLTIDALDVDMEEVPSP